ncbi:hypothetical protein Pyn_05620 [Prunus yedoensis var. nudiflora]|uniref:Uncharacterized protein n=1 Tax=Prunus yedoensis var. nudiflora TaxID=2094558 RepID=A0A314URC5_PRUYE|nr:hypothetical protein Pyn_05620 [Prunus yedoensis var. nudiflora]
MSPAASLVQQKIRMFVKKLGKAKRKRYTVSLKCLSCPAFEEGMVESQPDVFHVKIEGPIELLSCTTEDFHKLMSKIKKEGH